jgi:cation:H+ antiporter
MLLVFIFYALTNDSLLFGSTQNELGFLDGVILLLLFFAFIAYVYYNIKNKNQELPIADTGKIYSNWITLLMVVGGLAGLVFGGKLVVDNAVLIAKSFNLSEKLIGLTIIAAGTSLPELAASSVAAFRGKSDIAIGNIIGSNIFNLTFILGLNSIFTPLAYHTSFNIDVYLLMAGSVALFLFMFTINKKKLDRWEAILFLVAFIVYMTYIIIRK